MTNNFPPYYSLYNGAYDQEENLFFLYDQEENLFFLYDQEEKTSNAKIIIKNFLKFIEEPNVKDGKELSIISGLDQFSKIYLKEQDIYQHIGISVFKFTALFYQMLFFIREEKSFYPFLEIMKEEMKNIKSELFYVLIKVFHAIFYEILGDHDFSEPLMKFKGFLILREQCIYSYQGFTKNLQFLQIGGTRL